MNWIKSAYTLKQADRLITRLRLTYEKNFKKKLLFIMAPIFILFTAVDLISMSNGNVLSFMSIRIVAVVTSTFLFYLLRSRVNEQIRLFSAFAPYLFSIQYVMIEYKLEQTPYSIGIALILFCGTILFPIRAKHAIISYILSISPTFIYLASQLITNWNNTSLLALMMNIGAVILCVFNSNEMYKEHVLAINADQRLQKDLRNRNKEIADKAKELLKRKQFESQFSPQVIKKILDDSDFYSEMSKRNLVTMVFDIKDSTLKSSILDPSNYKDVIEDVFDIINVSSLKWNITIDKFTGDGAQVFAGSPEVHHNDLERCISAATDIIKKLDARQVVYSKKWGGNVGLRVGICEGDALVGFLGRGMMKSFTAIGANVSFTHRICGAALENEIIIFSEKQKEFPALTTNEIATRSYKDITGLKGIENKTFKVMSYMITPSSKLRIKNLGNCFVCQNLLEIRDDKNGMPQIYCSACEENNITHASVA